MTLDLQRSARHARLRRWFRRHARDLPWRRTRDPYAILVSELMLQQTRVAVVVDRFSAFLARFPTIAALAAARQDDVVAMWSGLGYYRRARNLHAAARAVVERLAGRMPRDVDGLRALPGVGPYTGAAVASIAFGLPEPLVDGNVARVLSRWFRLRGDPRDGAPARRLRGLAATLVPRRGAGAWNEALMELGATVCLPRAPRCTACPVPRLCAAHLEGNPDAYPVRARAPAARHETIVRFAIECRGRWLLRRNGPGEAPYGLFEFPGIPRRAAGPQGEPMSGGVPAGEDRTRAGRRRGAEARGAADVPADGAPCEWVAAAECGLGLRLTGARELGAVRHRILDREITVRAIAAHAIHDPSGAARRPGDGTCWVTLEQMAGLPLSAAALRMRELLRLDGGTRRRSPTADGEPRYQRTPSSIPTMTLSRKPHP